MEFPPSLFCVHSIAPFFVWAVVFPFRSVRLLSPIFFFKLFSVDVSINALVSLARFYFIFAFVPYLDDRMSGCDLRIFKATERTREDYVAHTLCLSLHAYTTKKVYFYLSRERLLAYVCV